MPAKWLKDTVFYEIYPQSFFDTNKDGIGDINGIIEKLDYIKSLGCNALWINPCFDSPFKDAGYDVRDYRKVAPRYGTNNDLYRLFELAHQKGIRVLLDLVPGHTSEEHDWFKMSSKAEPNEFSGRYIWTSNWIWGCRNIPYIAGEAERSGTYLLNFFKCQPALNYGFYQPEEPWQMPMDHPDAIATREAIKDVMRFWLSHGCDGFRVDMAASLVKYDDEKKSGTSAIWRNVREMLDTEFPEAAMVAEWSDPKLALRCGYDADFYLSNWGNGYEKLMREYAGHGTDQPDNSYFRKDSAHDMTAFLKEYIDWYEDTKDKGYISLITCNHDTVRPDSTWISVSSSYATRSCSPCRACRSFTMGTKSGCAISNCPPKKAAISAPVPARPCSGRKEKTWAFPRAVPMRCTCRLIRLPTLRLWKVRNRIKRPC